MSWWRNEWASTAIRNEPADAVTHGGADVAGGQPQGRPWFLWVHYYDPHAPYEPPADLSGATVRANYLGEVAFVDREFGRLLRGIRAVSSRIGVCRGGRSR